MDPMPSLMAAFGAIVLARRAELQLSLRDVAARSGIDIATLSRCERGSLLRGQRIDVLTRLAVALDMPLEVMLKPYCDHVELALKRA